ncbi:MAG: YkgJ family cysteine cluster protein [Desulfonauticus sp.]|nr:YkgJ family cysteine cluster protein [Desulfonauticus sp.]
MDFDFTPYFKRYEELLKELDDIFYKVKSQYPGEVKCDSGCYDCCYALFDLHLIEALYLNHHFKQLTEKKRNAILIEADKADRKIYKIKRQAFKMHEKGASDEEIFSEVGKARIKCPLLNQENKCELYPYRPATCRVYGIPLNVYGKAHCCALSGFKDGQKYPALYMEKVYQRLFFISQELVQSLPTKYTALHTVLVPVSMALLTEYDADYLGIVKKKDAVKNNQDITPQAWTLGGK